MTSMDYMFEGGEDLHPPPTPSRLNLQPYFNQHDPEVDQLSLSQRIGDTSLETLTNEVARAQNAQSNEMMNKNHILKELMEELKTLKSSNMAKISEVQANTRKLNAYRDDIEENAKVCAVHHKDIKEMFEERKKVCEDEMRRSQKSMKYEKNIEEYRQKMAAFRSNVNDYYANSDVSSKIKEMRQKIDEYKQKISSDSNNPAESHDQFVSKAKLEIISLNEDKEKCISEEETLQNLISQERERLKQTKLEINMLQKRNTAQLIRTRRQLEDAQQKANHWREEVQKLRFQIDQMKYRLR